MKKTQFDHLVGHTPLLSAAAFARAMGAEAEILAKCEGMNPAGSAKDRAALYMIRDAEAKGLLREGGTVIEPTSGNTGIGLAAVSAPRGYRVILTMPDTMSRERIAMLRAYGAEVVLTPGALGMKGAVAEAERLRDKTAGAVILGQFDNPAGALAHYETTGPEILADAEGELSALVAGVGTGGTITGCGRYLKEHCPGIRIIAVEPTLSPLLSEGRAGSHALQGIGANFVPSLLDRSLLDRVMTVTEEDAYLCGKTFAEKEGVLVGISSGAALAAALALSHEEAFRGKRIAVILPDSGDRYLSSPLYD